MFKFTITASLSAYRATLAQGVRGWLVEPLVAVKKSMIRSFYGPKSGRLGPVRQRSARGQSPASQSKRLERSITPPVMVGQFKAEFQVTAPYAAFLNDPGILNRPFVQPAIDEALPKFQRAGVI